MMKKIFLLDNGSVKPAPTLMLRRLAQDLALAVRHPVDAVSLQHVDKIDIDDLHGEPAWVLQDYLTEQLGKGYREFILVPLFFSLNRALTISVPDVVNELKELHGGFELEICDVLYPLPAGDEQLTHILHQNILSALSEKESMPRHVVLVDHGSPSPRVTAVRQLLGQKLQSMLDESTSVSQAAMERRPGKDYDFNGPLLEDCLIAMASERIDAVLLCLLFLLPGRHAGPGGDIESICARVQSQYPEFKILISPLVSENPGLIDMLKRRVLSCGEHRAN